MAKVIDYYNPAHELVKILDDELVAFFNEYITYNGGIELQTQMAKWITQAKEYPVYDGKLTILNYVWYILSSENATQARSHVLSTGKKEEKQDSIGIASSKKKRHLATQKDFFVMIVLLILKDCVLLQTMILKGIPLRKNTFPSVLRKYQHGAAILIAISLHFLTSCT